MTKQYVKQIAIIAFVINLTFGLSLAFQSVLADITAVSDPAVPTDHAQVNINTLGDAPSDLFFGTNGQADRFSLTTRGSAGGYDLILYRNNSAYNDVFNIDWATGDFGISENVRIDGNLGIGKTPSQALDVTGEVRATGDICSDVIGDAKARCLTRPILQTCTSGNCPGEGANPVVTGEMWLCTDC
jgi:hypothetical protein